MSARAFLFPGQGSQYVGMGKDLSERYSEARKVFDAADEILGFSLKTICFEGPDEELKQTKNTQPAIFTHSIAVAEVLRATKPELTASAAAGHSLGEYSALVYAGALSFEDALRIVRLRGELMFEAGIRQQGTMAAVIGLPAETIERICHEATGAGVVQPANFNSPDQIVISGSIDGVHKAMELAKADGAKLVKELQVSGAFHSPLMEFARNGLKEALDRAVFKNARFPVYANVTAEPATAATVFPELLYRQLTSPVRWAETMKNMGDHGMTEFIEIGPGKVLQGLAKKLHSSATIRGIDKADDVAAA